MSEAGYSRWENKILQVPLVGQRNYLRATDIYTAVQKLIGSGHIDIRFLRPTSHPLRTSLTRQEGTQPVARVLCESSGTLLFLTAAADHPATRVAETDLANHQFLADMDNNRISFEFERTPWDSELLSAIFFRYQTVWGTKYLVARLRANWCQNTSGNKFTLHADNTIERTGLFTATVTDDLQTRFTIRFKPREINV